MEQTESKEIMQLRRDLNNLKEIVENLAVLMNKRLINELYGDAESIKKGEYLTEEEFSRKHRIRIH